MLKEHLKLNGKELDIKYPISLFDNNGNRIYYENSNGGWSKSEFDNNGNRTYYEDSDGFWIKREFDKDGSEIYHEDSKGQIVDSRPAKLFNVAWSIDIEATTAQEAARKSLKIMQNKDSTAKFFTVRDTELDTINNVEIDLSKTK